MAAHAHVVAGVGGARVGIVGAGRVGRTRLLAADRSAVALALHAVVALADDRGAAAGAILAAIVVGAEIAVVARHRVGRVDAGAARIAGVVGAGVVVVAAA